MNSIQAVALGVLQGLTEFLPVSSSGHLVIGQKLFSLSKPPVFFDILVHIGTLLAVLIFFRKQFFKVSAKTVGLIFIGTIPAGLVGLFLDKYTEIIFNSLFSVGISLLITALLLFSTKFIKKSDKNFSQLKWIDALFIGCFQALAIFPGISRSGSTVVPGLWRGLERETSFAFSFYLAVPAILGALVLQIPEIFNNDNQLNMGLIGLITAAVSGFVSLKLFEKIVLKGKLFYFGMYCFILGIGVLLVCLLNPLIR